MSDEELKQLIASNVKAIAALTDLAHEILPRVDEMQRQSIDIARRNDNNSADIRELTLENQRFLKYLESIVNRQS